MSTSDERRKELLFEEDRLKTQLDKAREEISVMRKQWEELCGFLRYRPLSLQFLSFRCQPQDPIQRVNTDDYKTIGIETIAKAVENAQVLYIKLRNVQDELGREFPDERPSRGYSW